MEEDIDVEEHEPSQTNKTNKWKVEVAELEVEASELVGSEGVVREAHHPGSGHGRRGPVHYWADPVKGVSTVISGAWLWNLDHSLCYRLGWCAQPSLHSGEGSRMEVAELVGGEGVVREELRSG